MVLLLAFLLVPILEIAVFITAGDVLGLWPTIGLVVLTAVVGAAMIRHQGFTVLRRTRARLDRGDLPVDELFDGICILVAGVLLLTPGFVTDTLGFALMVPWLRRTVGRRLFAALQRHAEVSVYIDGERTRPEPERPPPAAADDGAADDGAADDGAADRGGAPGADAVPEVPRLKDSRWGRHRTGHGAGHGAGHGTGRKDRDREGG